VGGHLVAALGALVLALFDLSTLRWELMVPLIVIGLGAGTTTPAMSLSILDAVDRSRSGLASGLLNGARQCGGVVGVALLGALLGEPPTYAGAQLAFLAAFVALALASIAAFSAWSWIGK
jgi:DHA2 family methylenomycin A resistance protein-like MFS transporter